MYVQRYFVILHNSLSKIMKGTVMHQRQRLRIYAMLEKMTGEPAVLQINEAITELKHLEVKQEYKSRMWYIYDDLLYQMNNTSSDFATAISAYIPQQDVLILSASEQDDITVGFSTVIKNNIYSMKMYQAFFNAMAYPLLMLSILFCILVYFSLKIIPEFLYTMPQNIHLSQSSLVLVAMSEYFYLWSSIILTTIVVVGVFIVWALPNFINKYRKYLDNIIPFNVYRIMIGCSFLFSLNSLTASGYIQYEALEQLLKITQPYLRYRIVKIMQQMSNGVDIGQALINIDLNFPDKDMLYELAIHLKYSHGDTLDSISQTLVTDGLEKIKRQAQILRFGVTLIVFMVIAFLYVAIYQFATDLAVNNE